MVFINTVNYKGCGVYAIVNPVDMKIYIGSSYNVSKRLSQHSQQLGDKTHINKELCDYSEDAVFRTILLKKFPKNTSRRILLFYEHLFIYNSIGEYGFKSCNKEGKDKRTKENLKRYIFYDLFDLLEIPDTYKKQYENEFEEKIYYMRPTSRLGRIKKAFHIRKD